MLNIGHTVAVTQNYVSSTGLPRVLDFLRPGRKELVSGCGMEDRYWGGGGGGLRGGAEFAGMGV